MTRAFVTLMALLIVALSPAAGQTPYPVRPVKVLVPYAPGGATDVVARIVADQLRQTLGQSVVIENKPGAFGILAIEEMARAKPDGHTLMIGNVSTNAITPVLFAKKFSLDYQTSVVPVARIAELPTILVATTKDFAVSTLSDLITYAKKNPGKVLFGSAGIGSFNHFDFAVLAKSGGIDLGHIPIKAGASGMMQAALAGDVQVTLLTVPTVAPMIKAGVLKPLAVVGDRRLPDFPDVPTFAEAGFPAVGTVQWQALFAPAGTPASVVDILRNAVIAALETAPVKSAFDKGSIRAIPTTSSDEAQRWLQAELAAWRKTVAEVKIEVEN